MSKEVFNAAAIILTFVIFLPYIVSIHRGRTKPHVFSWVIWGIGTLIVACAQMAGHAGIGAWPIGISGLITCYIAGIAYLKRGDILITRTDWGFFITSLATLPIWFLTANPLWAVVILTLADLIAFIPTIRKAFQNPYQENATFFTLSALRNLLVLFALEHYSLTTALFPAAIGLACLLFALMLVYRRRGSTC